MAAKKYLSDKGIIEYTGELLTKLTVRGISIMSEPHPVPRGRPRSLRRFTRERGCAPYVSIFGIR